MQTTADWQIKHPQGREITIQPPGIESVRPHPLTESELTQAIREFPNGSAGGPDNMCPQYLKELLGTPRGVYVSQFCELLAGVGDLMLQGSVPSAIHRVLSGANLFAFRKKCRGIRPIAVGFALRRLVARIVSTRLSPLSADLRPIQLGFAVKGRAEAAVYAARSFLESNSDSALPKAFVQLDVKNAFNSLDRNTMLEVVIEKAPQYLPFVHQCYGSCTVLLSGSDVIVTARGRAGRPNQPFIVLPFYA